MKHHGWILALGLASGLLQACIGEMAFPVDDEEMTNRTQQSHPPFAGDPANNALFGVDVSFWEGPISQWEMDCMWDAGVRHLIAGTQYAAITKQQLQMAAARGMTVDAYIYLYWGDMKQQVDNAFAIVAGLPVARMWLDIEEEPIYGGKDLLNAIQKAVDACKAHKTLECGIYTGDGFWDSYLYNETRFADIPLWYANWNGRRTTLSDWPKESFGGWQRPVGKQFAEEALCGVGLDQNVIQVNATPTVVVDRTLPPDAKQPPPAPGRLYPSDGMVIPIDFWQNYVKFMSEVIPRATRYQFALELWYPNSSTFRPYYTWTLYRPFLKAFPVVSPAVYRFRARAENARGWGSWSAWSTFDFGKFTGTRPPPAGSW